MNSIKIIPEYLERINLLPTFAPVNKRGQMLWKATFKYVLAILIYWRDGRVVDCGGLENRWTERFLGFESLSLRKSSKKGCFLFYGELMFSKFFLKGEMLEWLKRHAWKACKPLKGFAGSNPALSAEKNFLPLKIPGDRLIGYQQNT